VRRLVAAALLVIGVSYPALAAADAPQVLLIRPPGAAHAVNTALVRVEGELVADGFEVISVEAAPGTSSETAMKEAESQSTSTTVGLFLSADGTNAELWVVDRLTNKTVVRRVATGNESENLLPEVLAVRAVELLRASLLELVLEQKAAAAARPKVSRVAAQRASDWAAQPLRSAEATWAIETGAAVFWNPGQVEPAFVSVGRGRFAPSRNLQIRLSFIGLGTRPQVAGTGGSASIAQWCGLAEVLYAPLPNLIVKPVLSLGAGTFHSSVTGQASFPYQGVHDQQWAFAADASLGMAIRLASKLELSAEAHTLWAAPEPIVRFVSEDGPHIGHPAVIGTLSLTGWL
jgi:hypothetical protein